MNDTFLAYTKMVSRDGKMKKKKKKVYPLEEEYWILFTGFCE